MAARGGAFVLWSFYLFYCCVVLVQSALWSQGVGGRGGGWRRGRVKTERRLWFALVYNVCDVRRSVLTLALWCHWQAFSVKVALPRHCDCKNGKRRYVKIPSKVRSTALPSHQKKERLATNKNPTNGTYETTDAQTKKACNRGTALERSVENYWGEGGAYTNITRAKPHP